MTKLTNMQQAFVEAYAQCGNAAQAARAAGYAEKHAKGAGYRLLKIENVKEALAVALRDQAINCGPAAIAVLKELLTSENERIKLTAAQDLADRSGLKAVQKNEIEISDRRTAEEIEADIAARMEELGMTSGTDTHH